MSRISPTISGQSWEFALAQECAVKLNALIASIAKQNNKAAVLITNQGWQLSFRIHSGNKLAQPSLKFAISLIDNPHNFSRYEMGFNSLTR